MLSRAHWVAMVLLAGGVGCGRIGFDPLAHDDGGGRDANSSVDAGARDAAGVDAAGLDVLDVSPLPSAAPQPDPTGTLDHWTRFDPFRDAGGSWRLRLRRRQQADAAAILRESAILHRIGRKLMHDQPESNRRTGRDRNLQSFNRSVVVLDVRCEFGHDDVVQFER